MMIIFGNLLLAPFRGLLDMAEAISAAARRELEDPEYILAKLLELQLLYELEEIDEAEYESGYQELSEKLQAAQQSGRPDNEEDTEKDEEEEFSDAEAEEAAALDAEAEETEDQTRIDIEKRQDPRQHF